MLVTYFDHVSNNIKMSIPKILKRFPPLPSLLPSQVPNKSHSALKLPATTCYWAPETCFYAWKHVGSMLETCFCAEKHVSSMLETCFYADKHVTNIPETCFCTKKHVRNMLQTCFYAEKHVINMLETC